MTTNNITGDSLRTKPTTTAYLNNYDAIFGKKNIKKESENNHKDSQNDKQSGASSKD